jgi:hypothetical protein
VISIKSYKVVAPLINFSVYPFLNPDGYPHSLEDEKDACPLILTPSLAWDVSVRLPPSYRADKTFYRLAALGAARFIFEVRGVPLSEIEVEVEGEIYKVARSENDGKIGIKLPKCKEKEVLRIPHQQTHPAPSAGCFFVSAISSQMQF